MTVIRNILISGLFLAPLSALAADEAPQPQYQKVTEIEFNEQYLSGEMLKPGVVISVEHLQQKFPLLVQLRGDFDAEMAQSVEEVR